MDKLSLDLRKEDFSWELLNKLSLLNNSLRNIILIFHKSHFSLSLLNTCYLGQLYAWFGKENQLLPQEEKCLDKQIHLILLQVPSEETSALMLEETFAMDLTQLNQQRRKLLFGSPLNKSTHGSHTLMTGSTNDLCINLVSVYLLIIVKLNFLVKPFLLNI